MPMPLRPGYRPMTPRPLTPLRPVQKVQNSPMIATPGQRPPPPLPPRLGSIAGQPQYPQPLPGGMQQGGRVRPRIRPRPMRAPAAQPTTGGFVSRELSPSNGQRTDDVNARLNAGEFVIPKDAAAWLGKKFFYDLIAKARKARGAGPNGQPNGQMRTGYGAQR